MERWHRRIGLALVAVGAIVLVYTMLYQWAMATFEGQERSFATSLQVVIESLTTAGFGGDADHWTTTQMSLLVVAMNLTGVLLVFLALPLFAVPMFREAFDTTPPTSSSLTDHVIICGHSRRDEVLCGELDEAGIPYLYIDTDPETVSSLRNQGIEAMLGDSERIETLRAANIEDALAVVADINDEANPTVILSAKRANPTVKVVSVGRLTGAADYHRYAGAERVIEAPQALGESLGLRAVTSFAEKFRTAIGPDHELEVTELLVEEGSELIGMTLRDIDVFDDPGTHVIGGWYGGRFRIPPDPDIPITENTIFLVAGQYDHSAVTTRELPKHLDDRTNVLICGAGVVGRAAASVIDEQGNGYDVVDIDPSVDPDIVGDVTDPDIFIDAEVGDYRSIILALNRDTTTIYATLILNKLAPDVELIARVHNPDNVWKLYSAGADFVLSMSVITGEMLAAELIGGSEIVTAHDEFEFGRVDAGSLAGQTLGATNFRSEIGASVLAIDRQGDLITEIGPDFKFERGDELVIAGRPASMERFRAEFG